MIDISWISQEAQNIHAIFVSAFYGLAIVFLLIGVVSDLLSIPIGGLSWTPQLVGRVLIAFLLLYSYPEVTNTLSGITDALAFKIGGFNAFHHVLSRMGGRLQTLTWSWISIKDALILAFSFITFFLLYISVFIANGGILFVWLLLYVFSPLLIVFFILPSTSQITKSLYRALFEVCAWKIVWVTLAALLWSSALSHINKTDTNFLSVLSLNIILALSLLLTPFIVNALASKGLASAASGAMGLAAGVAAFTPGALVTKATKKAARHGLGAAAAGVGYGIKSAPQFIASPPINKTSAQPKSPPWVTDAPLPQAPPPWLQAKLAKEKDRES